MRLKRGLKIGSANKIKLVASDGVLETGLGSRDTFLKVSSRSRLGLELQVSVSSLGLEKSWFRNMRSLETQNLG